MCQKCNEALLAAAQSAGMLARAAKDLYSINQTAEAKALAKAAAELFAELPKEDPRVAGDVGTAAEAEASPTLPAGMYIDPKTDIVYLDGVAIGRAILIRKPSVH